MLVMWRRPLGLPGPALAGLKPGATLAGPLTEHLDAVVDRVGEVHCGPGDRSPTTHGLSTNVNSVSPENCGENVKVSE